MTISYNWLSEYLPAGKELLPELADPEKMSRVLTAIGLEVESLEKYEATKGGLKGLVTGEIISCEQHPDATKLKITMVDTGGPNLLQIVCGAPNAAAGQKVIVATIGSTLYPSSGLPVIMKKARIRGVESYGMICAEDEIGLGQNHDGIMVLPAETKTGIPAAVYFDIYEDYIFEIGLTPNRIDAMSHIGVAKDLCAWSSQHHKTEALPRLPFKNNFKVDHQGMQIAVVIADADACQRYAGLTIQGVTIAESPAWLQQRLISTGLRPVNNIVDITNFILHETGQPLHAFDADMIKGQKVVVKKLAEGTVFVTLDEKERKLSAEDLMICIQPEGTDCGEEPMCIAGVYGGLHSGVTANTRNIFLESAWFDPVHIRKTALRHGLRTDAAARFEKGVDISNLVNVLKRAAMLMKEVAGGEIASDIVDVYPLPRQKKEVSLKYHYLKKLSGKNYHPETVKNILHHLGFELIKEGADEMRLSVPFSKPDVSIPADLVEEIMRIDGLDNVEIPVLITTAPSAEILGHEEEYREKIAAGLAGSGFNEIFTNSITNSAYYANESQTTLVKMANNLTEELDTLRPSLLETGLERVAFNLNRKNNSIRFFEFGKAYRLDEKGKFIEINHLGIFISGKTAPDNWKKSSVHADIYFGRAVVERIVRSLGLEIDGYREEISKRLSVELQPGITNDRIGSMGMVSNAILESFDIRQPVFFAELDWDKLLILNRNKEIRYREIPRYPAVERDLAILVDRSVKYRQVEKAISDARIGKLKKHGLFDVFESEKLGAGKKSMAISLTFQDEEKTLTDEETDSMMNTIISVLVNELNGEVRK